MRRGFHTADAAGYEEAVVANRERRDRGRVSREVDSELAVCVVTRAAGQLPGLVNQAVVVGRVEVRNIRVPRRPNRPAVEHDVDQLGRIHVYGAVPLYDQIERLA